MKNRKTGILKSQDFIMGLVIVFCSLLVLLKVSQLPSKTAFFPKIVIGIMGFTGLVLLIQSYLNYTNSDKQTKKISLNIDIIIVSISLVITWGLLKVLGFYTSIGLLTLFLFVYSCKKINRGTLLRGVIFTITLSAVLFLTFQVFMGLPTPKGILI